jgi:hypothetical protein
LEPAGGVAGRPGLVECCCGQAPDLAGGERDQAGVSRRRGVRAGGGVSVPVRSLSWAAVTAQIARAAMTSTACRAIAVQSRAWHWSRPKQPLASSKLSSAGQRSPAALISRALEPRSSRQRVTISA